MARPIGMDMTHGSLLKKMVRFSIPLILTFWLQLSFSFADVMVLGMLVGDKAVGAVGSTGSLTNLVIGFFIGISTGANILVSKYLGAGNQEKVRRVIGLSILLSVFFGLFLLIVMEIFSMKFLTWMGSPEELIEMSNLYYLGMPIRLLYNFAAAILRASGETLKPLIFLCIGGVVNVGLNVFSVTVLNMTVEGVAIATVASEVISAILCVITLVKNDGAVKLCRKYIKFYKEEFIELLQQGVPSGIQSCLFNLSNVIIQSSVNSFGAIVVSGNSYAQQVENFVYHGMYGFSFGCMSFVSANYGARKFDNIKKVVKISLILTFSVGIVMSMGLYALRYQILRLFAEDPHVVEAAATRMTYICRLYFMCGIMEVFAFGVKGLGRSTLSMIISLFGACVLRIIWISIMLKFYNEIWVVYIVYVITWVVTAIAQLIALIFTYRKKVGQLNRGTKQLA